jgi:hypothetical protein
LKVKHKIKTKTAQPKANLLAIAIQPFITIPSLKVDRVSFSL